MKRKRPEGTGKGSEGRRDECPGSQRSNKECKGRIVGSKKFQPSAGNRKACKEKIGRTKADLARIKKAEAREHPKGKWQKGSQGLAVRGAQYSQKKKLSVTQGK